MKQKLTKNQIDFNLEKLKIFLRRNCIPCTDSMFEDVKTSMINAFNRVSTRKSPVCNFIFFVHTRERDKRDCHEKSYSILEQYLTFASHPSSYPLKEICHINVQANPYSFYSDGFIKVQIGDYNLKEFVESGFFFENEMVLVNLPPPHIVYC
jgi:hypothetical protein